MKTTSKWMHENQFIIDNDRNFLIAVTDPCGNPKFGDPTSWDLLLMGFSGCVSSEFLKIANKKNLHFSDLITEINVNTKFQKEHFSFIVELNINTSAPKHLIQECLDIAISHCPLGIFTSNSSIPIFTKIITENTKSNIDNNTVQYNNIKKQFLQ